MKGAGEATPTDYDRTTSLFEWYIKRLQKIKPQKSNDWNHLITTPHFVSTQNWEKTTTDVFDQLETTPFYYIPRMYANTLLYSAFYCNVIYANTLLYSVYYCNVIYANILLYFVYYCNVIY